MLAKLGPSGRLLAFDRDPEAVREGTNLVRDEPRLTVQQANFGRLGEALTAHQVYGAVDGVVVDLGVSTPQLEDPDRGFSFRTDGPLDMRMDPETTPSAAEWINSAERGEIARVITQYGEERSARRIARAICVARGKRQIDSTLQLANIVEQAVPQRRRGKHPATQTFQAIRIFINKELEELRKCLEQFPDALKVGGRLCVISFHSLEDRIVKRYMRDHSRVDPALARLPVVPDSAQPRTRLVTGAVHPSESELADNPRARSAVMRVVERLR
jgi:16S rRNA (cytosine1402-N4)-methyltransferase